MSARRVVLRRLDLPAVPFAQLLEAAGTDPVFAVVLIDGVPGRFDSACLTVGVAETAVPMVVVWILSISPLHPTPAPAFGS